MPAPQFRGRGISRVERLRELLRGKLRPYGALKHIWWGVSVENKKHGLPRIEKHGLPPSTPSRPTERFNDSSLAPTSKPTPVRGDARRKRRFPASPRFPSATTLVLGVRRVS